MVRRPIQFRPVQIAPAMSRTTPDLPTPGGPIRAEKPWCSISPSMTNWGGGSSRQCANGMIVGTPAGGGESSSSSSSGDVEVPESGECGADPAMTKGSASASESLSESLSADSVSESGGGAGDSKAGSGASRLDLDAPNSADSDLPKASAPDSSGSTSSSRIAEPTLPPNSSAATAWSRETVLLPPWAAIHASSSGPGLSVQMWRGAFSEV